MGVVNALKGLVDRNSGVDNVPNRLLEGYKASSPNTAIGLLSPSRLIEDLADINAPDLAINTVIHLAYNRANGFKVSRTL